jgi:hypothetical protein
MITWPVFCWLFYKLLIYTLHLVLNFMPTKIYEYSIIVLFELWFPVYFLAIMQGLQVFPVSLSAERNSLYIYLGGLTNSPRVKIKTWRKKMVVWIPFSTVKYSYCLTWLPPVGVTDHGEKKSAGWICWLAAAWYWWFDQAAHHHINSWQHFSLSMCFTFYLFPSLTSSTSLYITATLGHASYSVLLYIEKLT